MSRPILVIDTSVFLQDAFSKARRGRHHLKVVQNDPGDTVLVRVAEAVYAEAISIVGADQVRYIVSEDTGDFPPGAAYAGFLFGTAHTVLKALEFELADR